MMAPVMMENPGTIPGMAKGHRVRVVLECGADSATYDPPHWPANACDWTRRPEGHPLRKFDIIAFEVVV